MKYFFLTIALTIVITSCSSYENSINDKSNLNNVTLFEKEFIESAMTHLQDNPFPTTQAEINTFKKNIVRRNSEKQLTNPKRQESLDFVNLLSEIVKLDDSGVYISLSRNEALKKGIDHSKYSEIEQIVETFNKSFKEVGVIPDSIGFMSGNELFQVRKNKILY